MTDIVSPLVHAREKPSNSAARRPGNWMQALRLTRACVSDGLRFWRHSFTRDTATREKLRALIAMDLHFLEYGMSLRSPRLAYGADKVARLIESLERYVDLWGADAQSEIGAKTLEAYAIFNRSGGKPMPELETRVAPLLALSVTGLRSGRETVSRQTIQAAAMIDFLSFARARHSIRQYAEEPVAEDKIRYAVEVAQQSPSSCNRQTCRVHIWTDKAQMAQVLALQSGNRGFGAQLGGVCVIWTDIANWTEASERYNGYVDGGMFAMSLANGLHAAGLGTVMLNWSEEPDQDKALRRLIGLPDSAMVITMLGFGALPETLVVPISARRPIDTCLVMNAPLAP